MKFAERLKALFKLGTAPEELFNDLCDLLVEGDIGTTLAFKATEELRAACARGRISEERQVKAALKAILAPYARPALIEPPVTGPGCFLVLGVNGVGKTTTIAKLAFFFGKDGRDRTIVLAAGDTFRAAAIDQLKIHGERLGVRVVAQEQGSDPGAVIFDALESEGTGSGILVIADTAGRMHTKQNLVKELAKIDKIINARVPREAYRKLLVVDATTGRNAVAQAEAFRDAVEVDALVVTKYDSTAKGGIVLAAAYELGIPTAFIGSGERYEDFSVFNPDSFLNDFIGLP
ncbi:MAG: signal recognition particle-docking protein FtsY [Spirochaetes bacterium]|nr:signal recognition particle-docking protein FtsY [Spirochaetota bacterium]